MNSLISIIIPVYNHAHTLRRSFLSISKQTYTEFEVIVVNDGSTDDFASTLEAVKKEFTFSIKVVEQQNMGASAARNAGFRASTGAYVIFWDADTVAKPDILKKLLNQLQVSPEAAYSYCKFKYGWKIIKSQPFKADDLRKINFVDTTSLIRREALADIPGPFDESLKRFQDWDLWLTLLEKGRLGVFVPEVLFTKIVDDRKGMSTWLPRFLYTFNTSHTQEYNRAKEVILKKHSALLASR